MANVEDQAFSAFMDDLGGAADTLRALKTRMGSLVARAALAEFQAIANAHSGSDLVIRYRSDATDLPELKMSDYNTMVAALGTIQTAVNGLTPAVIEAFTPRAAQ